MTSRKFIFVFLLLGFIFRYVFITMAPSRQMWDAKTYIEEAHGILSGHLVAECCNHNVGYSLFVAAVFFIFGNNNLTAVKIIQIGLDLSIAILIFVTAKSVFGKKGAWVGYLLYLFNPITSAYTGMILSEALNLFFVMVTAFFITRETFFKKKIWWLLLGLSLGFILFTKLSFYYYILIFPFVIVLFYLKRLYKLVFLAICFFGIFIASVYSLVSYKNIYGVWSLTPPYSMGTAAMYVNFYSDYRYPELVVDFPNFNPEYSRMFEEYYRTPVSQKLAFNQRYNALFRQKIQKEWPSFIRNVGRNMIWIWDKKNLYVYEDPFYPKDTLFVRIYNIGLLGLFMVGMVHYGLKKGRSAVVKPIFMYSLLLFLYISFTFTIVSNETRHTIPFYPLLFLWAGYGISRIILYNV